VPAKDITGNIFDIQMFSINDGPGIRTTVFFKGCPLRCLWCSNPESQQTKPQLYYFANLCTKCHRCVAVCPNGAIIVDEDGNVEINRKKCKVCGSCVSVCLNEARKIVGENLSVEEVFALVKRDELFYRNSGGGVTFSGGEPTLQSEFLLKLLKSCTDYGFHTALDTCGYVSWDILKPVIEMVELVLFDIKHINPIEHKRITGESNQMILNNLRSIIACDKEITVRFPLIPGYNDSRENLDVTGSFLNELGIKSLDILPYHRLGIGKYKRLGLPYMLNDIEEPSQEKIDEVINQLENFGLQVSVG
jgi:glycyl-radical enzyme activating protein